MDEFEMKNQIMDSIDDSFVPDLTNRIISKHLENSKKVPFWKTKLFIGITSTSFACLVVGAIVIGTTIGSNSNVYVAQTATEEVYGVSTLSLANVISVGGDKVSNLKDQDPTQRLMPFRAPEPNQGDPIHPWIGWEGWNHISQNSLNRALKIINPYMYVTDLLLKSDLKIDELEFVHNHRYGFEEYKCSIKQDEFECGFNFIEKATNEKNSVSVKGNLNVSNASYSVSGRRKNVVEDIASDLSLTLNFENEYKSSLTFQEKKFNVASDVDRNSFVYTYKENGTILYEIKLSMVTKFVYGFTPNNCIELSLTSYLQPIREDFTFIITRNPMDNKLNLFLSLPTFDVFIDVVDEDENYVYYIDEYKDDPLSHMPKH